MRSIFRLVPVIVLTSLLSVGCTPPHYRTTPDLSGKMTGIKTLALLEPDIKVCEVSAGGVREQKEEWCKRGIANVTQAIINRFAGTSTTVKLLKRGNGGGADETKELLSLYDAVSASIILHTYNEQSLFPDKKLHFEYSIGSLEALLKESGADALLLIQGEDEIATAGKKAMNVLGALTGVAAGAFTGVVVLPRVEGTYMRAALAGRNGDILWYNFMESKGSNDLRDEYNAAWFVAATMEGFPELGK